MADKGRKTSLVVPAEPLRRESVVLAKPESVRRVSIARRSTRRVLIAVDGSEHSANAFEWYVNTIYLEEDEIILAYCVEMAVPDSSSYTDFNKDSDKTERALAVITDIAKQLGVRAAVQRLRGTPGEAIVQAGKDLAVNMIVVGSRGLGKLRRTILGSVSDYVIHHSHIPVIICKS